MDYETADGSQFSLREVWRENGDVPKFKETLITALVDGKPYAGRSSQMVEQIDDADVLQTLEAIPVENVFPAYSSELLCAPKFDADEHYLKAPQFTHEDSQPGQTFVADNLLHEARVLEQLERAPHPNIVIYYGCVVRDQRITHLCLKRSGLSLTTYAEAGITAATREEILAQVRAGIEHLHSLGLAHNDINPGKLISLRPAGGVAYLTYIIILQTIYVSTTTEEPL